MRTQKQAHCDFFLIIAPYKYSYLLTYFFDYWPFWATYLLTYFLLKYDKIGTTIQIERSQHVHSSVRQTDSCTEPVQTAAVAQKGP